MALPNVLAGSLPPLGEGTRKRLGCKPKTLIRVAQKSTALVRP